jgi:hypothetical protein
MSWDSLGVYMSDICIGPFFFIRDFEIYLCEILNSLPNWFIIRNIDEFLHSSDSKAPSNLEETIERLWS